MGGIARGAEGREQGVGLCNQSRRCRHVSCHPNVWCWTYGWCHSVRSLTMRREPRRIPEKCRKLLRIRAHTHLLVCRQVSSLYYGWKSGGWRYGGSQLKSSLLSEMILSLRFCQIQKRRRLSIFSDFVGLASLSRQCLAHTSVHFLIHHPRPSIT